MRSRVCARSALLNENRGVTKVSTAQCREVIERQCFGFQTRSPEFWIRQNTTPCRRQTAACMEGLRPQLSAPLAAQVQRGGRVESILDNDSNSSMAGSRQVSQRTDAKNSEYDEGLIEAALCTVVTECSFSVAVADPNSLDSELIAVSEGFCQLTGYSREEVIGENCRFLNKKCNMPDNQRRQLFEAVESGSPFTGVVVNQRKSGELFLNLLDLRGLVLAKNARTQEDIWVLLAVQLDVTGVDKHALPESHSALLRQVASRIRKRLQNQIAELGLGGAMIPAAMGKTGGHGGSSGMKSSDAWYLLPDVVWRPGTQMHWAVHRSFDDLPELPEIHKDTSETESPPSVGRKRIVKEVSPENSAGKMRLISENLATVRSDISFRGRPDGAVDSEGQKIVSVVSEGQKIVSVA